MRLEGIINRFRKQRILGWWRHFIAIAACVVVGVGGISIASRIIFLNNHRHFFWGLVEPFPFAPVTVFALLAGFWVINVVPDFSTAIPIEAVIKRSFEPTAS